jgi:hypothetical protein
LATMKKRENLYIQYWLNLRQLAEKKTQLWTNSNIQKMESEWKLKTAIRNTDFLISTKSTENEAYH